MEIVCSIDDLCNGQYFLGHGHAHEPDNLLGCLEFSPHIVKDMSNQDIEDAIISGVNSLVWFENLIKLNITDQQLRDAIRKEVASPPGHKPFKDMDIDPESEVQLFGYIHFYALGRETNESM